MPSDVTIRAAQAQDVEAIARFQEAMALETEGKELDAETVRRGVAAVLADSARGRYLVALRGGTPVGCLMITYEWSDWRCATFWWIQSVYVAREARGTGVFGALYRHVEAEARADRGVRGLRLYVEHENEHAQRVYAALGMRPLRYHLYEVDLAASGSLK